MRSALEAFSHFFVQNRGSKDLLNGIGFEEVTVSGDTRFDRVQAILEQDNTLDFLTDFVKGRTVVVAGSTWPKDEELLTELVNTTDKDLAVIIAPHHMDMERFQRLKKGMKVNSLLYSEGTPTKETKVFLIDTIGLLTRIYSYADVAFVGGGFDREGIHNILEPAVFATPIVIGPVFDKYQEAVDLVDRKGCLVARDQQEFFNHMNALICDETFRRETGRICRNFILENTGSTKIIVDFLDLKV
jgi:3-deoxy-D-manno-octulosonic-acid transferase